MVDVDRKAARGKRPPETGEQVVVPPSASQRLAGAVGQQSEAGSGVVVQAAHLPEVEAQAFGEASLGERLTERGDRVEVRGCQVRKQRSSAVKNLEAAHQGLELHQRAHDRLVESCAAERALHGARVLSRERLCHHRGALRGHAVAERANHRDGCHLDVVRETDLLETLRGELDDLGVARRSRDAQTLCADLRDLSLPTRPPSTHAEDVTLVVKPKGSRALPQA
jgi:hypothetical protein